MFCLGGLSLSMLVSCRNNNLKMSCSQLVVDRIDPYVALCCFIINHN